MKFLKYIKDKFIYIVIYSSFYIVMTLLFFAFKVNSELIWAFTALFGVASLGIIITDYLRKKKFYNSLLANIESLDKAYLVLETLEKPNFYEGELLYDALYAIDKSMCENVLKLKNHIADFKDYIEMWVHEVKMPISSLLLRSHNHKKRYDEEAIAEMKRIEDYVEQVLYYARAEDAEKDYLIKKVRLSKVFANVALRYKDILLEEKINLVTVDLDTEILTDAKWLEFILGQVISNAIKYRDPKKASRILVYTKKSASMTLLKIEDNGIGISLEDLPRVCEKSFTGKNGHAQSKSTGMGLYIAKTLSDKLGHKFTISSKEGLYTEVSIAFSKDGYYEVL